jgi:hypothetical protein
VPFASDESRFDTNVARKEQAREVRRGEERWVVPRTAIRSKRPESDRDLHPFEVQQVIRLLASQ